MSAEKKENPSLLTVKRIYDGDDFQPEKFSARWLKDGSGYVTLEPGRGGQDIVRHDPETGQSEILVHAAHLIPPGESAPLKIEDYAFSNDMALVLIYTNSKRVWRRNTRGDYWVLDRAARVLFQLGGDARPSTLMFAKFSPTGRHVAYVREKNIYVEDVYDRDLVALTTSDSPEIINGTFDWVYEEELGLRDGYRWSPDGKSVAYWQLDTTGVPVFTMINNTDGLYSRPIPFKYPKVGQRNSAGRIGVVDVSGGRTRWLDVPGDPRNHYIAKMEWVPDSQEIVLQQLNRRQNTLRIMLADPRTGKAQTILTETDDAWIDVHDELMWFDDAKQFTWLSDRDGWRHIYLADRSGEAAKPVTPGLFDVIELLAVDEKQQCLYFLASPDNPTQKYLYRVAFDGTGLQRLTPADQSGTHGYEISPCRRWAIHSRSSFDVPSAVELIELSDHSKVRTLVKNKQLVKRVQKLRRTPSEFFRVDIGDGVLLDGWCIKPPDFNPKKKYPLLVYVYGEPAGQTVRDSWGGSSYLWHVMLAQRGYLVMSFDNRGTRAPRGRTWRKCVYKKIGVISPQDQAAALRRVSAERPYIDADRVGIWGWSGGGSSSLNAIFKYPKLYKTAMAVAPVTNERYYDTIYQERYMGLPGDNVDGFLKGSSINYAHQLEGNLLIVHGTGDDNCHYQTTEALINELIRHNKPFTMMAYPNRTHSIREGANTTRHLRELLTRYLTEHLPPAPRVRETHHNIHRCVARTLQ